MTVERQILLLLERARLPEADGVERASNSNAPNQHTRVPAREIYAKLRLIRQQTVVPISHVDLNIGELLVRTAEVAIHQGDFDTAMEASIGFFCECKAKNQFYCRALLARAQCEAHAARLDVGPRKLRILLNAIHFITQVVPIATDAKKRPTYDFLVYNASVVYWHIARQLMKSSTFQFLVPSLSVIIEALKLVKEEDVAWVVRLQMALVNALIDSNQLANAAKVINEAVDERLSPVISNPAFGPESDIRTLYEEALRLQVHVGSLKDAECQKILPNVKKAVSASTQSKRLSLIVKLQCLRSGNPEKTLEDAFAEIFQEATGMTVFSIASTTEIEVREYLASLDPAKMSAIDAETVLEVGIQASLTGVIRYAVLCDVVAECKRKNMQPKARLQHQILKAVLSVMDPPSSGGKKRLSVHESHQLQLSRRVDAVKSLERTLLGMKRLNDPNMIERVCIISWNLCLPLLQPHLRTQVERPLNLASSSLEEHSSLLLEFRARLYLEIAKMDAASEFLVKAHGNASKGIGLDYGSIAHQSSQLMSIDELCSHAGEWTTRSLDLPLQSIKRTVQVKLVPESKFGPEDTVFGLIQEIKEAKDRHLVRQLVARCQNTLESLEHDDKHHIDNALHLSIWSEVAAAAWKGLRAPEVARKIIQHILDTWFSSDKSDSVILQSRTCNVKSAMMHEVDLRLLFAEVIGQEVKVLRDRLNEQETSPSKETRRHRSSDEPKTQNRASNERCGPFILGIKYPEDDNTAGSQLGLEGVADTASVTTRLKLELLSNLSAAITAATRIGWGFVLENTCVYLWNLHFHVFLMLLEEKLPGGNSLDKFNHDMILPECIGAFELALTALESVEAGVSRDLLCSLALGLCVLYEKSGRWDKAAALADSLLKRSAQSLPSKTSVVEERRSYSILHLKQFAEIKARTQLAQNAKEIIFPDSWPNSLRVAGLLEAVDMMYQLSDANATTTNQLPDKAQALLEKAIVIWQVAAPQILVELHDTRCFKSLEDGQQHTQLLTELWTRLGFCALRLRYPRFAVECAKQALLPVSEQAGISGVKEQMWHGLVVTSTQLWFALAEYLYGSAIVDLAVGQVIPQKLIATASTHLANAAAYALAENKIELVAKACSLVWNSYIRSELADPEIEVESDGSKPGDYLAILLDRVIDLVTLLQKIPRESLQAAEFYGDMIILAIDLCQRRKEWGIAFQLCSDVLAGARCDSVSIATPATAMQQIQTAHAISAINTGNGALSNMGSSSRQKDIDPLLQARILKQIAAASSSNPPEQFKLLITAHSELQDIKIEQAPALLDIAEWFHTNCYPLSDISSYIDSAIATLVAQENTDNCQSASAKNLRGASSRGLISALAQGNKTEIEQRHPLWFAGNLIRAFMMKAIVAEDFSKRLHYIALALQKVEDAWEAIFNFGNEAALQAQYAQAKASAGATATSMDYDIWKTTAGSIFPVPHSFNDWVSIMTQLEKSAEARFYMPWAQALAEFIGTGPRVIADPGLVLYYLEELLQILYNGARFELMLPVIYLYQTLLFGAIPRRKLAAALWADLLLFVVLEHRQLTSLLSVPLQTALGTVNASGEAIAHEVKESLSTLYHSHSSNNNRTARIRALTPHLSTDAVSKTMSSISILLDMGFIRHAKALLEMFSSALGSTKNIDVEEITSEYRAIECRVLELEGQHSLGLSKIQHVLSGANRLDLLRYLQLTQKKSKLTRNLDDKYRLLDAATKEVGCTLLRYVDAEQAQYDKVPNKVGDVMNLTSGTQGLSSNYSLSLNLDVLVELAQIKFKQATIYLKQASAAVTTLAVDSVAGKSRALDFLRLSRGDFDEAIRLLTGLSAERMCGKLMIKYIAKLNVFLETRDVLPIVGDQFDIRQMVCNSIINMESEARALENRHDRLSEHEPWEIDVMKAKLQAAIFEILFETATTVVEANDMTWYEHELNSKRSIVEKWLIQTDSMITTPKGGDLAKAMTLVASVSNVSQHMTGNTEIDTLAQVLNVQIHRLSKSHSDERLVRDTYLHEVWTQYGINKEEDESGMITWICANRSSLDGSPLVTTSGDEEGSISVVEEIVEFIDRSILEVQGCQRSAFELQSVDLVQRTAYELVQLLGCRRSFECAMNLLLYQSCVVTKHMNKLFQLCLDPASAQAIHLRRMKQTAKFHADAAKHSLPFQLSQLYLGQQSDAFKRMTLGTLSMEEVISALPPNYRILSLQFSPEKCFLFAALVVVGGKRCATARIEFTRADMKSFQELIRRVQGWRTSVARTLLSSEAEHGRDDTFDYSSTNFPNLLTLTADEDVLEKEMSAIVDDTANLLQPLLSHPIMQSELKNELNGNPLVILSDRELSCLPLESLTAFEGAESIARDFSIHMFYHRFSAVKNQPVRRDEVRTIVDPYKDDTDGNSTEAVIKQHCKAANSSLPWRDAVEHGQIPSVTDWLSALSSRRGGSLIYLGPHRVVGSSLPLTRLAGMNVGTSCHVLVLLDHAENVTSSRRQSKWDNDKLAWELEIEVDPYLRALLLSLVGVNSLVMNQWVTTFNANRRMANGLLQGLAKGQTIGRALQGYVDSTIAVSVGGSISTSSGGSNTSSGASLPPRSNPPSQVNSAASLPPGDTSISGSRASITGGKMKLKNRLRYNTVLYGLSHLVLKGGE